ncbi:MAG: DUF58 domain-containing protein [Bacteroidales bacterium]|nr:DUF58 domain-containing protein [Bacteroidales bacterium]
MKKFLKSLYLTDRIYYAASLIIIFFVAGYYIPLLYALGKAILLILAALFIIDILLLYNSSSFKIKAERILPAKLSNGDDNEISIFIKNNYKFLVFTEIIDEIPFQFQKRDFLIKKKLLPGQEKNIKYLLRPKKRGEYDFGNLNIYTSSALGIIQRRFTFNKGATVPVYPSFIQMRKYELKAIRNNLTDYGIKKLRKISNNREFEQIKNYVYGDDFRTVNWKATARRSQLMVNQYQDERAQRVYNIIDMGRTMKMPFDGMSLLDYAINASLVISNIALKKHDKAGLITFSKKIHSIVPAERKNNQISKISEVLYKQETDYEESGFELLYATVKRKISQRSLLFIYTNFEGFISLERQIKYFKQLAKNHLVVIIFFENSELKKLTGNKPETSADIYNKTIAEKFRYEKVLITKKLKKNGIYSVLTEPQHLTVETINKYLELKAKGLL